MIKTIADLILVWTATIAAILWTNLTDMLPIIKDIATTFSALAAAGFSLYMLKKNWSGWWPTKKK